MSPPHRLSQAVQQAGCCSRGKFNARCMIRTAARGGKQSSAVGRARMEALRPGECGGGLCRNGTVQKEDFVVASTMQRGFETGVRSHAVFGRQEGTLQHYHKMLEQETAPAATAVARPSRARASV